MKLLSKWVWDKNVGADTALEYVNRGVRCREVQCKCLKVIFVWAKYCFLIPFIRRVDVRGKSHLDPSALRLSIPATNFKEFFTALVSLIVYKESSIEIE